MGSGLSKSTRKQAKDPEGRMPLADHLRELRNRLIKSVLAIVVITIVCAFFYKQIADFLTRPVLDSVGCKGGFSHLAKGQHHCADVTVNGLLGPFTIAIKVSLTAGVVLSCPVWTYQLWAFLAPGLHKHEKRYALSFVGAGVPLFLAGAWFAYAILPTSAAALIGLTPANVHNLVPLDDYLDLITRLVVIFGLSFELPLLLVLLNFTGVITGRRMLGWWRVMVLGITVFAAVATPTGDPLTMSALAAPIVVLYFAAVMVSLLNDRRKARRRAADPDFGLDDDEASHVELTPEPVEEIESVPAAGGLDEPDGFDDVT
jgi:sec-independent protein translocase protein TatC